MSQQPGAPDSTRLDGSSHWPTIPGYDLVGEIAAGGMATVYLAHPTPSTRLDPLVAIKHCHPHLRRDPTFVSMFLDEARLASLIRHPNVVATFEIGNAESLYFVMQYVDGVSLADWLARLATTGARIPVPLLLRVILDTLAGLAAAHAITDDTGNDLCLVHRDMSPQNILIGLDGVAKIADFGIAKAESRATRTRTGQVKGKTGYMSPEQILLEPLDRRSDLYAIGVVMWEALAGHRLFDSDSDAATINLVLGGRIPAPSTLAPAAGTLDDLVLRALSFQPADRFPTARVFAQAIEATGIEIADARAVGENIAQLFAEDLRSRRNTAFGRPRQAQSAQHLRRSQATRRGSALPSERRRLGRKALSLLLAILAMTLLVGMVWLVRTPRHRSSDGLSRPTAHWPSESIPLRSAARIVESALPPTRSPPVRASSLTNGLAEPSPATGSSNQSKKNGPSLASQRFPSATRTTIASAASPEPAVAVPSRPTPSASSRAWSKPSEYRPSDL